MYRSVLINLVIFLLQKWRNNMNTKIMISNAFFTMYFLLRKATFYTPLQNLQYSLFLLLSPHQSFTNYLTLAEKFIIITLCQLLLFKSKKIPHYYCYKIKNRFIKYSQLANCWQDKVTDKNYIVRPF